MNRLHFLKTVADTAGLLVCPRLTLANANTATNALPTWPLPDLKRILPDPVTIRSVELLKTQGNGPTSRMMLVVTAQDGKKGITQCNDRMPNLTSLLKGLVLPHFVGKDARDLPQLVRGCGNHLCGWQRLVYAQRRHRNRQVSGRPRGVHLRGTLQL